MSNERKTGGDATRTDLYELRGRRSLDERVNEACAGAYQPIAAQRFAAYVTFDKSVVAVLTRFNRMQVTVKTGRSDAML